MTQAGFVIDLDRCTGCSACVIACTNENPVSEGLAWRTVFTSNPQRMPNHPVFHYSLACNHCLEPACLMGCPARAYEKDPRSGAVVLHSDRCMGCGYCSWVCAYDAPQRNAAGVMEKCTFCSHRLEEELEPMCVGACPTDALRFDPGAGNEPISRAGFPETGLKPSISVHESRRRKAPLMSFSNGVAGSDLVQQRLNWRGFTSEWSLWFFTTIATVLVAWFTAAVAGGESPVASIFSVAGVAGMAVSALHLGRPGRMWRSFFGFPTSWISREIVTFSLFFAGACGLMVLGRVSWISWLVAAAGFGSLVSMDMVYRIRGSRVRAVPHSAMTTLTAVLYLSILVGEPVVMVSVAAVKAALYVTPGRPRGGALWAAVRSASLVFGVVAAVLLGLSPWFAGVVVLLGELMDRAELYAGLSFVNPQRQIDDDFNQAASNSAG